MPPDSDSPRLGAPCYLYAYLSSPACTFKISRYAAYCRYLIAYEINAHGWKKRLGLKGVGGGCILKNCYCQGGGGVQLSCVIVVFFFGGGVKFSDTPHCSDPHGRNKLSVPNAMPAKIITMNCHG